MSESITERLDAACTKIANKKFSELETALSNIVKSYGLEGLYNFGTAESFEAAISRTLKEFGGVIVDRFSKQEHEKILKQMQNLEAYFNGRQS